MNKEYHYKCVEHEPPVYISLLTNKEQPLKINCVYCKTEIYTTSNTLASDDDEYFRLSRALFNAASRLTERWGVDTHSPDQIALERAVDAFWAFLVRDEPALQRRKK